MAVNELLKLAIQVRAERHNVDLKPTSIEVGYHVWLYLDRVKDGYARNLSYMWHGTIRVAILRGECAVWLRRHTVKDNPEGVFTEVEEGEVLT